MIDLSHLPNAVILCASLVGGLALGLLYFSAVRATVDLILKDGRPFLGVLLALGRVGVVGVGFFLIAQAGSLALLAALAGLLGGRWLALYRNRRADA